MTEKPSVPFPDLTKVVAEFNRRLDKDLEPLTVEKLRNEPNGTITDGFHLKYGLYQRDGAYYLAVWWTSRFSNDQFREYDMEGTDVYGWSSWYGSSDLSSYPKEYQEQYLGALDRAIASGIGHIPI